MAMHRQNQLSRKTLVAWGAGGGAALLLPRAALGGRADTPPDGDFAYLRMLLGAELLAVDLYERALSARRKLGSMASTFKQLLVHERAHYAKLAELLTAAGGVPATSDDVDFTYPSGTFKSLRSIATFGWRIETLLSGAYLGAIESVETAELRLPIGQIASSEAHHLSVLAPVARHSPVGRALPGALSITAASNALDRYES
jgi:rubrerythrin